MVPQRKSHSRGSGRIASHKTDQQLSVFNCLIPLYVLEMSKVNMYKTKVFLLPMELYLFLVYLFL
jgi:hypothetical protein